MAAYTFFAAWNERVAKVLLKGATAPSQTAYRAILLADGAVSSTSTMAALTALELPAADGYSRKLVSFPTQGSASGDAWQIPADAVSWTFTAATDYRTVVIVADSNATRGDTAGTPVAYLQLPTIVTALASVPQEFGFTYLSGGCS